MMQLVLKKLNAAHNGTAELPSDVTFPLANIESIDILEQKLTHKATAKKLVNFNIVWKDNLLKNAWFK